MSQSRVSPKKMSRGQPCCTVRKWYNYVIILFLPFFLITHIHKILVVSLAVRWHVFYDFMLTDPQWRSLWAGASPTGSRRGHEPCTFENRGGRPPRHLDISVTFSGIIHVFVSSNILKIKWPKSEDKLNFGGRLVCVPMNTTPQMKRVFSGLNRALSDVKRALSRLKQTPQGLNKTSWQRP